jgi:hypothetical protein
MSEHPHRVAKKAVVIYRLHLQVYLTQLALSHSIVLGLYLWVQHSVYETNTAEHGKGLYRKTVLLASRWDRI